MKGPMMKIGEYEWENSFRGLKCTRYGEPHGDYVGDNAVLTLLYRAEKMETLLRKIHDYECAEGSLPVELSDALTDLFEC